MADPEAPSASATDWSRFIQLLAASPDVDLATLYGLLLQTRNLYGNLSKEAIEVLALRCLEGLYDPAKVLTLQRGRTSWSANRKEFRVDSSESAVNVLRLAIERTNLKKGDPYQLQNLRKWASDELVSNVHAFVEHKKTHLPNFAMKQQVGDDVQNASTDKENKHLDLEEKSASPSPLFSLQMEQQVGDTSLAAPEVQNTSPDKQNKHLDEKSASPSPVCLKRDIHSLQTEEHPRKKLKHHGQGGIASTEQYSTPIDVDELPDPVESIKMHPRKNLRHHGQGAVASTEQYSTPIDVDALPYPVESTEMHAKQTLHDCTQLDVCIKCKEVGEVLRCITRCCQIVVHERCLGFVPSYDNKGDFVCPVCAYSRAVSKCAEAKKNMLLATEEQSLFRRANLPIHARDMDKGVEATYAQTTSKDREPVRSAIPCEDIVSKQKGTFLVDRASSKDQQEGHLASGNTDVTPDPSSKGAVDDDVRHVKGKQKMQNVHGGNRDQQLRGPSKKASCDTTGTEPANNFKPKPSRNRSYNADSAPSPKRRRRTPLPWTEDEVKMLKEGMKRFAPRNNESIPWNNILDFGSSVFSKSRTGKDLKSKWRNLVLSGKTE